MYKKGTQATSIYSIGKGGAGVFRPVYRTPPFDKGKLLFPFGEKGGENRPQSLSFVSLKCAFW